MMVSKALQIEAFVRPVRPLFASIEAYLAGAGRPVVIAVKTWMRITRTADVGWSNVETQASVGDADICFDPYMFHNRFKPDWQI